MSRYTKYNKKRQLKAVSFLKEEHAEVLEYANSLDDFSGYVRGIMLNTHKTAVFTRSVVDSLKKQGFVAITYACDQYNNYFTVSSLDFRFYRMEENIFLVFGLEYFLVKDIDEATSKIKEIVNE